GLDLFGGSLPVPARHAGDMRDAGEVYLQVIFPSALNHLVEKHESGRIHFEVFRHEPAHLREEPDGVGAESPRDAEVAIDLLNGRLLQNDVLALMERTIVIEAPWHEG